MHVFLRLFTGIWNNERTKYLLSDFISKGSNYVLLLFFSYTLTVEQYGELSLYYSMVTLFLVVLSLNMTRGYIQRAYADQENEFRSLMATVSMSLIVLNSLFLCIAAVLYLSDTIILDMSSTLISTAIITSIFTQFIDLQNSMFNASRNTESYFRWTTTINLLLFFGAIAAFYFFDTLGLYSLIVSRILISMIATAIIAWKFRNEFGFSFHANHLRAILLFSLPLVMHSISGFILNYISRFMLNSMNGAGDTGLYSFAYNISSFVFIAAVALNNQWTPHFYRMLKEELFAEIERRVRINFLAFTYAVVIFALFIKEGLHYLLAEQYAHTEIMIYILILNYLVFYAYTIYSNYIFYYKKTISTFVNTTLVGIITIVLNLYFIPKYGYNGAAITTLISFLVLWCLNFGVVRWLFRFPSVRPVMLIKPILFACIIFSLMILLSENYIVLYVMKFTVLAYVLFDFRRRLRGA